jgi:4-hydroxybenzoate polyprenyltransferase
VAQASAEEKDSIPLCVDLDGTLVNSDTLVESAVLLVKANPFYLFSLVFWLFSGKAYLKEQIASRTNVAVATLPFNQPLVIWLREQRKAGRKLVLVTAANYRIAEAISVHLDLFDEVIASTATRNMSASTKRDELVARFGRGGYDYVGNSRDDVKVWSACRRAVLVNASDAVAAQAAPLEAVEKAFPREYNQWKALLKGMRPHQWSKNLLIFVSMFVAQTYTDISLLVATIIAFISFCLCSSSVYLINDLMDMETDRAHSEKHTRPFASGRAPVTLGVLAMPVLLLASGLLAWWAGAMFLVALVLYFIVTLAYSLVIKRIAMMDVLVLAILYTLRIIAGASVAHELPSVWLMSFSMFIFTSLAMAKRYAELRSLDAESGAWASGRGYHVTDLSIIAQLGTASGYISILVLALYIDTQEMQDAYQDQRMIWLLCPLLMYWIGRIWLLAGRGVLTQDPVVFATRDKVSYMVFLMGMLTFVLAL